MVTASLLYTVSVYERFIGMLYFRIAVGPVHANPHLRLPQCPVLPWAPGNPCPSPAQPPLSPTHLGQEILLVCLHPKAGDAGIGQAAAMHQLLHPCDLRHGLELWPRGWRLLGGSLPGCLLFFSILHCG